jgi:hypothetical protein
MSKLWNKWEDLFKRYLNSSEKGGKPNLFGDVLKNLNLWGKHDKDMRSLALGMLIASGAATAKALYANPTVKATIESAIDNFFTGKWKEYEPKESANNNADFIIELLKAEKVIPIKLAVDGLPGSGKSTLARTLAEKLGFQWKSLDHQAMNKTMSFNDRSVYEHHRLLRTQDPDNFEAIIYFDEPVELAKERVISRNRVPMIVDVLDFEKLKAIGDKAFSICSGKAHTIPGTNIKVKIKPKGGFKAYKNIVSELSELGINPEGLSKEQLLFLSIDGKAREGLKSYINTRAYNKELLTGLTVGLKEFFRAKEED